MGQVEPINLILLGIALVLSAFFSSSETAFLTLQRIRIRHLERTGVAGVARMRRLADQPERTLVTILIGNNLVNTASAALGTVIVTSLIGAEAAVLVATLGVTLLLLIFGEITPKTIAIRHGERLALMYALPLELFARLVAPLSVLLGHLGAWVATLAGGEPTRTSLTQEEIRTVLVMGEEAGVLRREETKILRNVLELENTLVREVMVPRTEVLGIPADQPVGDIAHAVARRGYTRMPVYEGELDHVVGIVQVKDVLVRYLAGDQHLTARQIMHPALFTPETKTVSALLGEMRAQNTQMAIIVDEYGGTAGIVTLEDLLEEVVGEITSEFGAERRFIRTLSDREIVVDSAISIFDLNEAFNIDLPTEGADTLGGFVFQHLGRIPDAGDSFDYQDLHVRVLSMRGRRVGWVRITREPPGSEV
jgi:putative hemolysin